MVEKESLVYHDGMKAKILFFLVIFLSILGSGSYFLSNYVVHQGRSLGVINEISSQGTWPFRVEAGLYQESFASHQRGFIVRDTNLADRLKALPGRELVLETQTTFLSLFSPYNEEIIGYREAPEPSVELIEDDKLCRLVSVIARSQDMVRVLRPRIEKYDSELLEVIRDCQSSEQ